ncbi:MAG: amidohydrolase family protein [archaeon]|nr:amidohydrolase family protein [archaeon]
MDEETGLSSPKYDVIGGGDHNPLLGGLVGVEDSSSLSFLCGRLATRHQGLFFGCSLLAVAMVLTLLIIVPLYAELKGEQPLVIPPPPPDNNNGVGNALSPAYDFPVWPGPVTWNISADHDRVWRSGPLSEVTWSHLDVSSDGRLMVFDVLGDLFSVPLDPATLLPTAAPSLLLGGVAWTREPRFHPNASFGPGAAQEYQRVVFTSDQSGLDNLWTLSLSSGALLQLTHESFRWVSSPAFSPDGASVAAVKWLTSTRSLGAGELWLYGAEEETAQNGGRLLLGIATPSSQLGAEEPAFMPCDGAQLMYSLNTAEGNTFQYSQDVHQGLYSILQRDISTNSSRAIVGGYGGSARPVVSHDCQLLALVRRTLFNTSLIVRELATGNERVLYGALEIDMQDSYSPCGNYPNFAFSPSDDHIIIWSGGRFLRIAVSDGSVTTLPLEPLELELRLTEPLRFPITVADGDSFLTNVTLFASAFAASANQQVVAFTSVAQTYISQFNAAGLKITPEALLLNLSQSQFAPSLSPDGSFLVHALWDDRALGSVQLVRVRPSFQALSTEPLTTLPGRYATPTISPDGMLLAYANAGPNSLTGTQYPLNTGVFLMSLAGRVPVLVSSSAYAPRWLSPTLLSVMAGGYPNTRLLLYQVSTPAGSPPQLGPPRIAAWSKYATDISLSPDLAYVAFVEFGWVYLVKAPQQLPDTGLEVSSRPGHIPEGGVLMCSPEGGVNLEWREPHWTDNASPYLTWLLGSKLFQVQVSDVSGCWATSAATNSDVYPPSPQCVYAQTHNLDLSTRQPTGAPAGDRLLCLTNATIVTMSNRANPERIALGELQIRGEIIVAVIDLETAPAEQTCAAIATASDMVVDLKGALILPGFIDAHAHWDSGSSVMPQASWQQLINLAFGVTTMHNPSATTAYVYAESELIRSGSRLGPRTLSTGTIVYGAGDTYHQEVGSVETALQVLSRHQAWGCQSIKSYNQPQRYARQMVLQAARQLQMNVVPEGGMMPSWDLTMIVDSHTTIEHNIPIILKQDAIGLWAFSGTASTPTLLVCYGDLWGENWAYQHENVFEDPRVVQFTPARPVQARSMRRSAADDRDYYHIHVSKNVRDLAAAGVTVEIGAHGQQQGIGYTWELQFFKQGGQSSYEVLFAATKGGASGLGLQEVGEIKAGFLADLTVFPADSSPLDDITLVRHISHVVRGGRLFETPSLTQLFPSSQPCPAPPLSNTPVAG